MKFFDDREDWIFLTWAYTSRSGSCPIANPETRASLQRLGFMTPTAAPSGKFVSPFVPNQFWMVLTKKGQRRAKEILAAQAAKPRRPYGPKKRPRMIFTGRT